MIRTFRHKGLAKFFNEADPSGIAPDLVSRVQRRLAALHAATKPEDLNVPGFSFHGLRGKPKRYSVHVNGPWCITFEWEAGSAVRVDLENYH
ncbi:MAG: type II toxin-antitoxin system RelE/ParE family toxin [Gammaproteobacteria bacterium]|nr:type II toxin-antitoxin system RelE/ParE family toxin [Gammaproteobacteria bacterium]MBI5615576.1 type II toxin-antitoxin system RelE/ParE family toxin [Gammaproteobacteria bacterium]